MDSVEKREEEDCELSDKRKQRSRKNVNGDEGDGDVVGVGEGEGSDGSGRRKRSGKGDDYDSRSKAAKKRQEENTLEKLSSFYEDGELEGGDKMGRNAHRGKEDFRKWDEVDIVSVKKGEDSVSEKGELKSVKVSDGKRSESRERSGSARNEHGESKVSGSDNKVVKSGGKDDRRSDSEKGKSKGKVETPDDRVEKPRRHRTPTDFDVAETLEKPGNADEDSNVRVRDKNVRETGNSTRSRTPEKSGNRHQDSENSEMDHERSGSFKRKEIESDDYKDDRDSKEDGAFDHNREWELPRHGYDRMDNERPHGRLDSVSNLNKRTEGKSGSNHEEWTHHQEERARNSDLSGSGTPSEDQNERYADDDYDFYGGRGQKSVANTRGTSGSQSQYGNPDSGSFNRGGPQGIKGNKVGRGGRIRPPGRDNQQVGMQLPMMGSPYGPLAMPPPGPMQPLTHGMSPGPPMSPGVFMSPFNPSVWPGPRGVDMSIMGVPPAGSPVPPGPRFNAANMGNPPNPAMYFNQSGHGRGIPPSISSPGFNHTGPMGRGTPPDKTPGGWAPPKSGSMGKAPSRGEQNDYSQNFVDTSMRPQNFIRELELTNVVEDYPKLRELIQKKDEIVEKSASTPMYYKCNLKEFELAPEFFGTKFDVILVDPPWEEYVHRAPGVAEHTECWTFEEIMNLKIEAIADTPSFIFLWVGDGVGLEQGRQCLKKWGFRRCEDICWVKTNKSTATPGLRHDSHTLFQHSKEHCLMGIKGTVRRSTDGHIIHANIDTDVIIAEEPPYGSTQKPEDMYRIVEHFALGRRRLELFGEDHNIRAGWLTLGKELSSSNFNKEAYVKNFGDKDGKVWLGGGGRNPPPEAPHLVVTTPDIEALRPKSPMKNQQQMQQQQSVTISLTSGSGSNRRLTGNSPQNLTALGVNQEASSSNPSTPAPWASSPMESFKGREGSVLPSDDKVFDMYGFNGPPTPASYLDFESYRQMNML
ncbi:N6-adenosine-methyltransferase non-catalytic subunit MTB [Trifolium repens]|nr:N6-adenosine-methyltransferase non-catalytic subunit MTB [Trifolium repens]